MTELLEQAFMFASRLNPAAQDVLARTIMMLADEDGIATISLTAEDRIAIARSRAETACGEYASDADVAALWTKHP